MKTIGVQLEGHNVNRDGQGHLKFTVDPTQMNIDWEKLSSTPIGTTYMMMLIPIDEAIGDKSLSGKKDESEKSIRNRFQRKLYAQISEKAVNTGRNEEDIKAQLKSILKARRFITESLSELDSTGYASAIYTLGNEID